MNTLYRDVLTEGRSPERATALLALANILYDSGYGDTLDEIETDVALNESLNDIIIPVEAYILKAAESLFNRLGVPITADTVNRHPIEAAIVMNVIITEIESFDDYDSLLAIIASGEQNEIILSNLISFIKGTNSLDYLELFDMVEDRLITIINNTLMAKRLIEDRNVALEGRPAAARVAMFLLQFPTDDISNIIGNSAYLNTVDQLIAEVDGNIPWSVHYDRKIGLQVAAIAIAKYDTAEEANKHVEYIAGNIIGNDTYHGLLAVYKHAGDAINTIFELTEVDDE